MRQRRQGGRQTMMMSDGTTFRGGWRLVGEAGTTTEYQLTHTHTHTQSDKNDVDGIVVVIGACRNV